MSASPSRPPDVYFTFSGQIDDHAVNRFFNNCATAISNNVQRIHILIQSPGGEINCGVAIHNYLKGLPVEVIVYNVGLVASAAVAVFLGGHVRKCALTAVFMIHKTVASIGIPVSPDFLRGRIESIELSDRNMETILRNHLPLMPVEKWSIHAQRDLGIDAGDAAAYKLIHEIGDWAVPPGGILVNI